MQDTSENNEVVFSFPLNNIGCKQFLLSIPFKTNNTQLRTIFQESKKESYIHIWLIHHTLPVLEKIQRTKPQRTNTSGMRWTAFSPDELCWGAISFLEVESEMELYIGKSSEAAAFRGGGEPISVGNRFTKNSSEARVVLNDLCILLHKNNKGAAQLWKIYRKCQELTDLIERQVNDTKTQQSENKESLKVREIQPNFRSQKCQSVECVGLNFPWVDYRKFKYVLSFV